MKKKTPNIPKPVLKTLADDIQGLMHDNQGRLVVLEIIEELPFDIRPLILEGLSAFYSEEMLQFFHLIKDEYGLEVEAICNRAIEKYNMAGLDMGKPSYLMGSFYKAYASCSRSTGRITIDVAWRTDKNTLYVECFYLTYNADGVHSFFLIPDMPESQYDIDRRLTSNMVEISLAEAAFLVKDAFAWNKRKMTRPAVGKFLYNKYLQYEQELSDNEKNSLIYKTNGKLTPRQVVNSFFYAIKQRDFTYLSAICDNISPGMLGEKCEDMLRLGTFILESHAEEIFAQRSSVEVTSYSLVVYDQESYHLSYRFSMFKKLGTWLIDDIFLESREIVREDSPLNPFNINAYCRVYEVVDLDELFENLEKIDNIREVEELPYGLHLRITKFNDDLNGSLCSLNGILADLIINGDEFVAICQDYDDLIGLHHVLLSGDTPALISRGEYEVSLVNAYNYVTGSYISFEDVLIYDSENLAPEKDLKFMSTIYLVKDRGRILEKLRNTPNSACVVDEDYSIFYQYEYKGPDKVLLAEYVLGADWLTLSTFGHKDMTLVRQSFEPDLGDYLELDGMEIRADGFFDILTAEMKKDYPNLEQLLKELYLNKWYNSRLNGLGGMSPSEASETEEGKQMLWSLIKNIHQNEVRLGRGKRSIIKLKEYLTMIEEKRKEKP